MPFGPIPLLNKFSIFSFLLKRQIVSYFKYSISTRASSLRHNRLETPRTTSAFPPVAIQLFELQFTTWNWQHKASFCGVSSSTICCINRDTSCQRNKSAGRIERLQNASQTRQKIRPREVAFWAVSGHPRSPVHLVSPFPLVVAHLTSHPPNRSYPQA